MTLGEIKKIINQGESVTVEFKKSTGQLNAAFETTCAFLNGQGGIVLIGVLDSGKILGQEVTDNTRREIASHLAKIEPLAKSQVNIQYTAIGNEKYIITVIVEAGEHAPYMYDGRAFYRNQSTTSKMSQHGYEQLLMVAKRRFDYSWEKFPANRRYNVALLDQEEIYRVVSQGIRFNRIPASAAQDSIDELLVRLKLLQDERLNNAAVVLFGKDLFPDYTQCLIKLGRFNGTSKLDAFIDHQQIYGNVFELLSGASDFLMRHLPIASFFQENKFERIDKPILPVLAVREAIINAICHRDYADRASHIVMALYNDRLEIWSYGSLPTQIKIEDLKKKHESYLRNEIISQVLYNGGLIEKWGTGINKMIALCKEADNPEPEFEEYSGGFAVVFKFKELIGVQAKKSSIKTELSIRQKAILKIIKKHEAANIQQIVDELEDPPTKTAIKKDLDCLRKNNLIELKGVARASVWALK